MRTKKAMFLRQLVAAHVAEAGGNIQEGYRSFPTQMTDLIEHQGVSLRDVSMGELFEAMCDPENTMDRTNTGDVVEAMYSTGFPTVVGQMIHPVILNAYTPVAEPVLDLVTQLDSKHKEEHIVGFGSTDQFELVREGMPYEDTAFGERYVTIKNAKFGRTISVSMEMVMFDQTGQVLRLASQIGELAGAHLHQYIIEKIQDVACTATGEAASTALTVDGTARAIYATDHSSWDRYANNNLGSADIDDAGMNAALLKFAGLVDDKNQKLVITPKILLVPAALLIKARKLIGSPNQFDTANNAINPFKDMFQIRTSAHLDTSSATAWYLGDFARMFALLWVYRLRTESLRDATQISFSNDIVAQFKAGYYGGVGATDYRYAVKGNA